MDGISTVPQAKRAKHELQSKEAPWHGCMVYFAPEGNLLLDGSTNLARAEGLGKFSVFPDDLLMDLLSKLPSQALFQLGQCSRLFHTITSVPDLWKPRALKLYATQQKQLESTSLHDLTFYSYSWKQSYRVLSGLPCVISTLQVSPTTIFSDLFFQTAQDYQACVMDEWLGNNNMETVDLSASPLSASEFRSRYEQPFLPIKLQGAAHSWKIASCNTLESLIAACDDCPLEAFDEYIGSFKVDPIHFYSYSKTTNDPRPLYVFDPLFVEHLKSWEDAWHVPELFDQDLMACLQDRPDFSPHNETRWLLAGAARTGTNFHVDPNFTSAWNTVLCGKKKWIMFPPHVVPPGVAVAEDGSVQQPDSVVRWFREHYAAIHDTTTPEGRLWHDHAYECICEAGDTAFIPAGWWHLVLNVEHTAAITQNYVDEVNLASTLRFLRTHDPPYMNHAGAPNLADVFADALRTAEGGKWAPLVDQALKTKKSVWASRVRPEGVPVPFRFFADSAGEV